MDDNRRDWEDSNKLGFVLIVQTLLIVDPSYRGRAGQILFDAMRVCKTDIPMDLDVAAHQFVSWGHGGLKPEWLKTEWTGSIAGL